MHLFGKKKTTTTPSESISQLQATLKLLEAREELLQKKVQQQITDAKKYMSCGNKRAALMCLKRKKVYEHQIERLNMCNMNIDSQTTTSESAHQGTSNYSNDPVEIVDDLTMSLEELDLQALQEELWSFERVETLTAIATPVRSHRSTSEDLL